MALVRRFRSNSSGNIAVIFAIALIPILTAMGAAVDYSMATRIKAKMQAAADAASVASLSERSPGFIAAAAQLTDGPVPAAVTDATNVFNGNMDQVTGFTGLIMTPTVTKTGSRITSLVTFTANVPVTFMKAIGWTQMTVTGSSSSSASLPLYLDFYLALDTSSSMGLPSTDAEQTRLAAINPDNFGNYPGGCTLACHFGTQDVCTNGGQRYPTNNYCMGYMYSRLGQTALTTLINAASTTSIPKANRPGLPNAMLSGLNTSLNGSANTLVTGNSASLSYSLTPVTSCDTPGTDACIQLRADAVGYAVSQLFVTAQAKTKVTNQFRIGLYPFIQDLYAYFALTSSINGSATTPGTINYAAANLASQLDTNKNASLGSGGTHIDTSLHTLNGLITSIGNGSASNNTLPYVFLVTDGAQDPQVKGINGGGWSGSNHATVLTDPANPYPGICTTIKNRGIKVAVLYIPYQPIQNPNHAFAGDEDGAANTNIQYIPASLSGCASPADAAGSYFYTANTPADINAALTAMFNHALVTAHLTN